MIKYYDFIIILLEGQKFNGCYKNSMIVVEIIDFDFSLSDFIVFTQPYNPHIHGGNTF